MNYLFLNYLRDSGAINTGLVKVRRSDGAMYYFDNGWRPAIVDGFDTILRWMGTVPTFSALPTNNRRGDVWTVLDQNSAEFAWDGNKWEFLGRPTAEDISWDHTRVYQNGEICYYNFEIYFSIVNNNQGNEPDATVGVNWRAYSPGEATSTALGLVRIATDAEVQNGVDVKAVVKPNQLKNQLNKKADLVDGVIPTSQIPGSIKSAINGYFYNDQFYYDAAHTQLITPATQFVYVDIPTRKTYSWSGLVYAQINPGLALGETSETAYPGNKGKNNADEIINLQNTKADKTEIPANITTQGNVFNAPGKLVQLDQTNALPPVDGSKLTGIKSGGLPTVIVNAPAALSSNTAYVITASGSYTLPTAPKSGDLINVFSRVEGVSIDGGTINIVDDPVCTISIPNSAINLVFDGTKWNLTGITVGRTIGTASQVNAVSHLNYAGTLDKNAGAWYLADVFGIAIAEADTDGQIQVSKDGATVLYSQSGKTATVIVDSNSYYRFFGYVAGTFKFIPFV